MSEVNTENNISGTQTPLLQLKDLQKYFHVEGKGELHAVDHITLDIFKGETLGLVGESGCGKSTVGNLIMGIHRPSGGAIDFEGKDITKLSSKEMHEIREKIQIVFQDPYSSINPKQTVRVILSEAYKIHHLCAKSEINEKVRQIAEVVGLEPYVLDKFPNELDGGKRQMVGIARALSMNPEFIVCDEPVSSLDVSVQATIINLLMDMQKKMNLTYLFISHDLSVVRHISNRVAVMYLGQIVEMAPTDTIFEKALHPYTVALLSAVPKVDPGHKTNRIVLKGDVSSPIDPKPGCRFAARCWKACEKCKDVTPELKEVEPGHYVSCPFWAETKDALDLLKAKGLA